MHIFYCIEIQNNLAELDQDESRHLNKVLRVLEGEQVFVTDGKGYIFIAKVAISDSKKTILQIIKESDVYAKKNYYIHIAVAPTKNIDRIEWFVEKAVEFGIDEITFIKTDRSERKNINLERLNRIAISAMKQSLKGELVKINELTPFSKFIDDVRPDYQKFVGHLDETKKITLINSVAKNLAYLVLIGPEGDFTNAELDLSFQKGFKSITLGEYRLRTETAALAACHILNLVNQI
jgi:16S rRNA (uracil1498-N3)-methyltransferase